MYYDGHKFYAALVYNLASGSWFSSATLACRQTLKLKETTHDGARVEGGNVEEAVEAVDLGELYSSHWMGYA